MCIRDSTNAAQVLSRYGINLFNFKQIAVQTQIGKVIPSKVLSLLRNSHKDKFYSRPTFLSLGLLSLQLTRITFAMFDYLPTKSKLSNKPSISLKWSGSGLSAGCLAKSDPGEKIPRLTMMCLYIQPANPCPWANIWINGA